MLPPGFHHIRVHAPGATESATVRNDFICMNCNSPLKEDVKFRVLGGDNEENSRSGYWVKVAQRKQCCMFCM